MGDNLNEHGLTIFLVALLVWSAIKMKPGPDGKLVNPEADFQTNADRWGCIIIGALVLLFLLFA
ncbi:MAG: hypothetical protein Q8P50_15580 [Bacillota bacterium]|nr:hypothetical protein [Bacillota bacterium]